MVYRTYVQPSMTTAHSRSLLHVLVYIFPQILELAGQDRLEKSVRLARGSVAYGDHPGLFDVLSQTLTNASYEVDTVKKSCTCKDSREGILCAHRIAVAIKTLGGELLSKLNREHITDPQFVADILQGRSI